MFEIRMLFLSSLYDPIQKLVIVVIPRSVIAKLKVHLENSRHFFDIEKICSLLLLFLTLLSKLQYASNEFEWKLQGFHNFTIQLYGVKGSTFIYSQPQLQLMSVFYHLGKRLI